MLFHPIRDNTYLASQKLWPSIFEAFTREIGLCSLSMGPPLSLTRTKILLECLMHTKNYLDTFLTISHRELASLSSINWAMLHYALLLTATVSTAIKSTIWNTDGDRTVIKLDTYIDALSARLLGLSSKMTLCGTLLDWYGTLLVRWDGIKNDYVASKQGRSTTQSSCSPEQPSATRQVTTAQDQLPTSQSMLSNYRYATNDGTFTTAPEFELLDFESNVGSWMSNPYSFSGDPASF